MSQERFEVSPVRPMPRVCIVYNQASGAVLHLHQIIAMPGAPEATDEELIAEPHEFAGHSARKARAKIATIVVERDALNRQTAYKVDVKRKTLRPLGRIEGRARSFPPVG